jgi:hypothetical protein
MNEKNRKYMEFMLEYIKSHKFFKTKEISEEYLKEHALELRLNEYQYEKEQKRISKMYGSYITILNEQKRVERFSDSQFSPFISTPELIESIQKLLNGERYPFMKKGDYNDYVERHKKGLRRSGKL